MQRVPSYPLQSIVNPWPFRRCPVDIIGEIHPYSSLEHEYIIVATDYFTKWTEVIPFRSITQEQVIIFIESYIFGQFGVP